MTLDNLVTAALSKTDAIKTLVAANKQLAEALPTLTKENEKLLVNHQTTEATKAKPQNLGKPNSYCWTHGFVMGQNYNSKMCNNKAPGHKTEGTKDNTMGGNLGNKPATK